MKKLFFMAITAAVFTVTAAELHVENAIDSMKKEWYTGTMIGKNTHSLYIGEKSYPDCWSYWYAASGLTPETAQFKPLNAIDPDLIKGSFWQKYAPIMAASLSKNGKSFIYPALSSGSINTDQSQKAFGGAYGFKNPFNEEVFCYIEGRLRHAPEAKVFVYVKSADGKITHLTDSEKPGALHVVNTTLKTGNVEKRQYLKLQIEVKLQAGDTVVFAAFRNDHAQKITQKKRINFLSPNDQWGKAYQPAISFGK